MKIILISGKAESGKNTFADVLEKNIKEQNKSVLQIAYADDVKHIAKLYFGWGGNKDEYGRYILQNLGTNRVRENLNKPNYWVNRVCDIISITHGMYDYILVPDARFPNEIDLPKKLFGKDTTAIRVNRPNHKSILTEQQLKHPSEVSLDNYDFDYIITNTTLKGLDRQAKELLLNIGGLR